MATMKRPCEFSPVGWYRFGDVRGNLHQQNDPAVIESARRVSIDQVPGLLLLFATRTKPANCFIYRERTKANVATAATFPSAWLEGTKRAEKAWGSRRPR